MLPHIYLIFSSLLVIMSVVVSFAAAQTHVPEVEALRIATALNNANLRADASTQSTIVGHLTEGQQINIVGEEANGETINGNQLWYEVQVTDGVSGFVWAGVVEVSQVEVPIPTLEVIPTELSETSESISEVTINTIHTEFAWNSIIYSAPYPGQEGEVDHLGGVSDYPDLRLVINREETGPVMMPIEGGVNMVEVSFNNGQRGWIPDTSISTWEVVQVTVSPNEVEHYRIERPLIPSSESGRILQSEELLEIGEEWTRGIEITDSEGIRYQIVTNLPLSIEAIDVDRFLLNVEYFNFQKFNVNRIELIDADNIPSSLGLDELRRTEISDILAREFAFYAPYIGENFVRVYPVTISYGFLTRIDWTGPLGDGENRRVRNNADQYLGRFILGSLVAELGSAGESLLEKVNRTLWTS